MDDSIYDTSWTLYSIPSPTTSLRALLSSPPSTSQSPRSRSPILEKHAEAFQNSLVDRHRPRYEDEEEREKLGGLRAVSWTRLAPTSRDEASPRRKQKRKRNETTLDDSHIALERGLLVSLVYDKATYRFAIISAQQHGTSNKRTKTSASSDSSSSRTADEADSAAIVLAKASPAVFKAFHGYLTSTFAIQDMHALKLPPAFLASTLARYISSIYAVLSQTTSERQLPQDMKAILGTIKLSISFSAPIAPSLKMLDVEVPSESVLVALRDLDTDRDGRDGRERRGRDDPTAQSILKVLSRWVHERTGISLPLGPDETQRTAPSQSHASSTNPNHIDPGNPDPGKSSADAAHAPRSEPPMRVSRILSAAYAISSEGRLKLSLKSAQTCEDGPADGDHGGDFARDGSWNVVRKANETLLAAAVQEAARQLSEDS
ncbi:uncharacterized protein A1O9_05616 [Exophiala aquamarina CBS 119918]|uniref:Uncharacterized protein n=1 Tax=Exophiala aquamarina CBS 119918 TaxID=1182545 RepID=A0A072PEI7_9EURO|nr:uncharacterized protein A1O9_05616 [Exophiala aquamarina CBS 119918]KEF57698.1 hypothetical protein A1O9_05616 [Exophiala aquamarina CBS 119918]